MKLVTNAIDAATFNGQSQSALQLSIDAATHKAWPERMRSDHTRPFQRAKPLHAMSTNITHTNHTLERPNDPASAKLDCVAAEPEEFSDKLNGFQDTQLHLGTPLLMFAFPREAETIEIRKADAAKKREAEAIEIRRAEVAKKREAEAIAIRRAKAANKRGAEVMEIRRAEAANKREFEVIPQINSRTAHHSSQSVCAYLMNSSTCLIYPCAGHDALSI